MKRKKDKVTKYVGKLLPKVKMPKEKHRKLNGQLREDLIVMNNKNMELVKVIDEIEKEIWKIRQLTFTKYNSNEWNNCLSFNDDILPIITKLTELKGGSDE